MDAPTTEQEWPHRRRFDVEYHHLDVLGHLNHAAYFPFMETLRCEYYLPLVGGPDPSHLDIILAEASCRFLAPARYGDVLVGEVAPVRPLGRTSVTLLYRFRNPERTIIYARGRTVVVCYDYDKGKKKEITTVLRAKLEKDAVAPEHEARA
ncbi:MAG: acyl-CoA thioesterase [Thermoplasmata archaeon]|nr:acyl-CoA thioesterase [Thermoplasmata archaeon]